MTEYKNVIGTGSTIREALEELDENMAMVLKRSEGCSWHALGSSKIQIEGDKSNPNSYRYVAIQTLKRS